MSRISFAVVAVATALVAASPAAAGVVLDQASVPETGVVDSSGMLIVTPGYGLAQSFTAGVSGWLDHVDLGLISYQSLAFLGPPSDLQFQLLDGASTVLAARDIDGDSVFGLGSDALTWTDLLSVDLRADNVNVYAGQTYLLKLVSTDVFAFNPGWIRNVGNTQLTYAGGTVYEYTGGAPVDIGVDVAFRTYVDAGVFAPSPGPGAAPEPAAWAIMIAGFGLTGATLRRRRLASVRA